MPFKNKACLKMTIHQEKAFQLINNIPLKAKKKLLVNFSNQTGGSFDFMENNLKGEDIIVHLLTKKNFTSMVEKILELDI
jgi:hypothetical protein